MKKGLLFIFAPNYAVSDYVGELRQRAEENPDIFSGVSVLFDDKSRLRLSVEDMAQLQKTCLEYGMVLQNFYEPEKNRKASGKSPARIASTPVFSDVAVHKTLRSGQKINCDGTAVIYGNVNESAEITAGGDVIVLGRLEGIVHAGCYGDENSIIFALSLAPNQLRIGNHISRSSGEPDAVEYPEIAYLEKDNIYIKRYNPREFMR
jgi:septum site-determining protein MinC